MGETYRKKVANLSDQVLGQAQDQRTLALVNVPTAPAPDYSAQTDGQVARGVVISITGNMADPNVTPPTIATAIPTDRFGRVAFHLVLPAGGTADVELWVDGGTDAAGNPVGWLLVDTIASVVSRKEYLRDVGQRRAYVRAVNTANINGGSPATLRATGVV